MTLPPVIRVFFAIDLPLAVKEKMGLFISSLKKKSKSHAIRWTRPENLHVTLQFLAEVKSADLPNLINMVREELFGAISDATLTFGDLHLFPNPYRPRVIVMDVMPQDKLALLSQLIGNSIKKMGYEIDVRPFRGHLTLGRIKHAHGVNLDFLGEAEKPLFDDLALTEVVLFRSEPLPEGSKYSALERITLKARISCEN